MISSGMLALEMGPTEFVVVALLFGVPLVLIGVGLLALIALPNKTPK